MDERDDHLSWNELESKLVKPCGIFDLYESKRQAQNGKLGTFHVLEAPDWVNVVPIFQDGEGGSCFLMVKQYRQAVRRTTVEFPAGLVEARESPADAAQRELFEETGYRPKSLKPIGTIHPNPAFMTNRCHTFLARELYRDVEEKGSGEKTPHSPGKLDELELLDVLLVPISTVVEQIGREPFSNSMTALALFWYLRMDRANGRTGADRIRTGA
jgi:ADP-ribose pyrophosphatase